MDFFINLSFGAALIFLCYIALVVWLNDLPNLWMPVVAVAISAGSYRASFPAIQQYGAQVKSAFDLYRGDLAKQLGFELPRSADQEREMWEAVTRTMLFRSVAHAEQLVRFRPLPRRDSTK